MYKTSNLYVDSISKFEEQYAYASMPIYRKFKIVVYIERITYIEIIRASGHRHVITVSELACK